MHFGVFLLGNVDERLASIPAPAYARPVSPRGELTAEERLIIDIFEKSKRSVVYISTSERVRDVWTRNVQCIPRGTASGFVWDDQGDVVTNYHVIAGASDARVRLNDRCDYAATLVGASPGTIWQCFGLKYLPAKLQARLDDHNPGERVRIGFVRAGKRLTV